MGRVLKPVGALLLTEPTQIKQMQFYKAGIYPHVDPFYIAQSAYIDILHIKPTLPVENFNLCVAFHIGEKVLLAENVYITIQYKKNNIS